MRSRWPRARLAAPVEAALRNVAALGGRTLMASLFLIEGAKKIADYAGASDYMLDFGVNPRLLPLVIATEIGGASLVLLGLLTRWASLGLAGFAVLTALFFHRDLGDANQAIQFEKNVTIAGGFLLLWAFGPGCWSLDHLLGRPRGRAGPATAATVQLDQK